MKDKKDALIEIRKKNMELESVVRIKDTIFGPRVSKPGEYRVTITTAKDYKKELLLSTEDDRETITVDF